MLDWDRYITVASKFQYRARLVDREDLKHDILIAIAAAEKENSNGNGHVGLSEQSLIRIASYECQKYWRRFKRYRSRIISLDNNFDNGNGYHTNLEDKLPDEKAVDLDAWIDAKTQIAAYPQRVLDVAHKILRGDALCNKEHQLLHRFRCRQLKRGR